MTITCADCGRVQTIPPLPPGATAECQRCDRLLARRSRTGFELTLACAAAIVLLPPAFFLPLMDATIKNLVFQESRLVSSVGVIYSEVWFPMCGLPYFDPPMYPTNFAPEPRAKPLWDELDMIVNFATRIRRAIRHFSGYV